MRKTPIIFFFVMVLLVSSIYSQPPFQCGGQILTEGYVIEYPKVDILKQNRNINFNFHIFNISNGVPISNVTTGCAFHLFNQTNDIIYTTTLRTIFTDFDLVVTVNGGNFSKIGDYSYVVHCNDSTSQTPLGGFDSVPLTVTKDGFPRQEIDYTLPLSLFAIMFCLLGFYLIIRKVREDEKTDN